MAKNIKEYPLTDRPYEKLERYGQSVLTNSELLAIIIKNGTKRLNCLQIAQNILSGNKNISKLSDLEFLSLLSMEDLKTFEGIGRVKAIQIKAVIELSKRVSLIYKGKNDKISCPKDVFLLLCAEFNGMKQEVLKTIILNKQNKVISVITNFIGNSDRIDLGIKEILSEPIKQMAHSIILSHNHPGGSLTPSKQDIIFTSKIIEYSRIFQIEVLDHIIIAKDEYFSLKENKYI
ncbi:MAG: DNA repair protein RadC [Clostridia bacterium]